MPEIEDIVFETPPTAPHRLIDPELTFVPAADTFADYIVSLGPELNEKLPLLVQLAAAARPAGVSTTSLTLTEGLKEDIAAGSGLMVVVGAPIRFASAANPSVDFMDGIVEAYSFATGVMDVTFDALGPSASGTHTDWVWMVTGPRGSGGDTFPSGTGHGSKVLQQKAGENGEEWISRDWDLIGTVNASAAANAIFASIPDTYAELYVKAEFTHPGTVTLGVQVSPDSAAYSTSISMNDTTPGSYTGEFHFLRYNDDHGYCILTEGNTTSPSMSSASLGARRWVCTGGIDALKFLFSSGNITGTFTLYGKK